MFVPYQTDFQLSFCITYMWMFYVDYIDIQSKCCLFVIVHSVLWLFTIFFCNLEKLFDRSLHRLLKILTECFYYLAQWFIIENLIQKDTNVIYQKTLNQDVNLEIKQDRRYSKNQDVILEIKQDRRYSDPKARNG